MTWSSRTVLVTGAGGFIGSHLVERLAELGARTRAFVRYGSKGSAGWLDRSAVRDDVQVFFGDIRDRDTVRVAVQGCDAVFHLAALIAIPYSYRAPFSYIRTNVEGSANVFQETLEADVGVLVHVSTSEVYGTALQIPIDESHPLQGQSPYSASKIAADKFAEAYHRSFALRVAVARPFNTYGPRQSSRAVIPSIISQALGRRSIELGNLRPTRDFTYVEDTVAGMIRVAECPQAIGEVINLGSGSEISIGDLATLIQSIVGGNTKVTFRHERARPDASEVFQLLADTSKAKRLLSWEPELSLRDGLARTVEWVGDNIGEYRVGAYTT